MSARRRYRAIRGWSPRQRWVALILFLSLFLAAGAFANEEEPQYVPTHQLVVIGLGESVRLQVPAGGKLHLSDGSIVRSRISGQELILTGKKMGRANLRLFNDSKSRSTPKWDRVIGVIDRKTSRGAKRFLASLSAMRGLSLDLDSLPALVVSGELLRVSDWELLSQTAIESKMAWRFVANVPEDLKSKLKDRLFTRLQSFGAHGFPLSFTENRFAVEVPPTYNRRATLASLGLDTDVLTGGAVLEPMIRTRISIAEVRKSRFHRLGIKSPSELYAQLLPEFKLPLSSVQAALNILEQEGSAKILAMPTLLCRSGGEAKFFAGGEIPIKSASIRTSHVEWKKYGISLNVKPTADSNGRMRISLDTEVSELDEATKADGIPGVLTNRVETQFNLAQSQTIVLSGLIKRQDSEHADGLPLFRSLPVLGRLFESKEFRNDLTELIAFVTPEVFFPDRPVESEAPEIPNDDATKEES